MGRYIASQFPLLNILAIESTLARSVAVVAQITSMDFIAE